MKILKAIKNFFKSIIGFIDKHIIVPITKLVISITKFFERSSKKIEAKDLVWRSSEFGCGILE